MSKAVWLRAHGGPDALRLETREPPSPGPGDIAVENAAIGVNFIDIYQRTGLYPVSLPAIIGSEGAGTIRTLGEGVTSRRPGERVAWFAGGGGYASLSTPPAGMAAAIPAGVSDEIAAASFLKGLTAEMLLRQVYPLRNGQSALVYAAAGGVGSILTQWAAHLGAEVVAVVGDEKKAALARQYGAAHVIIRTQTEPISSEVRKLTGGRGVDVAYDSIGAATFEASLESLAPKGMLVTYGNASGPVPPLAPLELSRRGSLFLTRPTLFHYATPDRLPAMAEILFGLIADGVLKPPAPTLFPLERAADAHRLLESGDSTGAIVLTP